MYFSGAGRPVCDFMMDKIDKRVPNKNLMFTKEKGWTLQPLSHTPKLITSVSLVNN